MYALATTAISHETTQVHRAGRRSDSLSQCQRPELDLGNGYSLPQTPTSWSVAGVGDFTGSGTDGTLH